MGIVNSVVQRLVYTRGSHGVLSRLTSGKTYRNICLYSEDLTNAAWIKTGTTIGANGIANPINGLVTADKLIEDGTTGAHGISQGFVKDTAQRFYNFSGLLKADGRNTCQIRVHSASSANRVSANIDLSTGSLSGFAAAGNFALGNASLTPYLNGWFRFSISGYSDTDPTLNAVLLMTNPAGTTSYVGSNPNGMYLFGAMLEANSSVAGEYVPTVASAVEQEV